MAEDTNLGKDTQKELSKVTEATPVKVSSYTMSFGDLSNLESLISDAEEKISKKGFNVEHFPEMRRIIKKIKSAKQ